MNAVNTSVPAGVFDLVGQSGLLVQLVLLLLASTSVLCWAIIWLKSKLLRTATAENERFLDLFWKGKTLEEIYHKTEAVPEAPLSRVYRAGYKELARLSPPEAPPGSSPGLEEVDSVARALSRSSQQELMELEKHLSWLATTASAAPFVGLFGTVWGIMNSFHQIGATGSANLAVVAPGISEALIATAVGLAAAIPAVIAYNYFVNRLKKIAIDLDSFSKDLLNIVQRKLILDGRKK